MEHLAQNFFNANFPPGTAGVSPTVSVVVNGDTITAHAAGIVATTFMKVVGVTQVTVHADSVVNRQIAGLEGICERLEILFPLTEWIQGIGLGGVGD